MYYANGSYYDPTIGIYIDAAPVSTMIDNAFNPRPLDRNAPVCNNIIELAGNPYTIFTATELSTDTDYDPYKNAPWYIQLGIWYSKLHWGWKLGAGILLFALAVGATLLTGGGIEGVLLLVYELCKGVLLGIGFGILGHLFTGEPLTWESIGNIALDSFLVTSAILFVQSSVSAIKYFARAYNVPVAQSNTLAGYELDPRSVELAKQGNPSEATFRQRVWQNEVTFNPKAYTPDQIDDMVTGLAPKVNGQSMHLHHVVGKSVDPYNVIKVTPAQHTAIHKAMGYHVTRPKLPWTLANAIKYGGLT